MGWLTYIEKSKEISLRHAWDVRGEKHLKDACVYADGFHQETNHVYNFLGSCMIILNVYYNSVNN